MDEIRQKVDVIKPEREVTHKFNVQMAETHGITAAIVYQCLYWHCTHPADKPKGCYRGTTPELASRMPYLSYKEVRLALTKLTSRIGKQGRFILKAEDGIERVYTICREPERSKIHSFDPKVAERVGVLPAIVYDNVMYWLSESDSRGDLDLKHCVSPHDWCKIHAYAPLCSVERAFSHLEKTGELLKTGERSTARAPYWSVTLGEGRLDRWYAIHRHTEKRLKAAEKDQRRFSAVMEQKLEDACVLLDPDLASC